MRSQAAESQVGIVPGYPEPSAGRCKFRKHDDRSGRLQRTLKDHRLSEEIGSHHRDLKPFDAWMPFVYLCHFHQQRLGDRPIKTSITQVGEMQMLLRRPTCVRIQACGMRQEVAGRHQAGPAHKRHSNIWIDVIPDSMALNAALYENFQFCLSAVAYMCKFYAWKPIDYASLGGSAPSIRPHWSANAASASRSVVWRNSKASPGSS